MSSHPLTSILLSSSAEDMYGRFLGRVIGISRDSLGDVTAIQVEHRGGSLMEYPIAQVSINKNTVVLIPKWKIETKAIQKEWDLTQKKMGALDNLLKSGQVSRVICESLRKKFEPDIEKLRNQRDALSSDLKKRHNELEFQIEKFENSIASIELERMVGGMDDQTYKTALEAIKSLFKSTISEKKDVETILEQLGNLDNAHR